MMKEKIAADFLAAYKAGEKEKKDCLGILKTRMKEWEKENPGKELTEQETLGIITKEIKKRKDSAVIYRTQDNITAQENAQKEEREIAILEAYLPAQLSDQQLVDIIIEVVTANPGAKNFMGPVMKEFNSKYKGQFDAAKVNRLTIAYLNSLSL